MILGVPTGGFPTSEFFDCAMRDQKAGLISNWVTAKSIYLDKNRNDIGKAFMTADGLKGDDLLLQVDDDIEWHPSVLPRLIEASAQHEVVFPDVCLGVGPTSALRWDGAEFQLDWPHGPAPYSPDGVAGAMFMVRRDLLELLPFGEWWTKRRINGVTAGEDMSFSALLRGIGVKPYCIPGLKIIHHRQTPLTSPLVDWSK